MRGQGGGVIVQVVMIVMVMVNEIIAKPTSITHQSFEVNHVEDQYLDDALGDWLDNFGTYTFMVKQDLDTHTDADEGDEGGGDEEEALNIDGAIDEVEEELREEVEGEWSAPIAISTGSQTLLDPRHDYLVTVESLVAEEGSIFLTLSKYENQTRCGVGGVTLEEEARQTGQGDGTGFHLTPGNNVNDGHTFISFDLQQESNSTSDTSKWVSVSEQYWWARGQLSGGGILSITFTPPECGCLALSTYFALPVGNLTLVVGPQAYPDQLQTLLCVDPLTAAHDQEYQDDGEGEEEEQEELDYIQPSALVASKNHEVEGEDDETEAEEDSEQSTVSLSETKPSKAAKKMAKKKRRQMRRQKIRQAGRRQARRQGQGCGGKKACRRVNRKKNQRKRTRLWQKLRKRERKARRRNNYAKHNHHQEEYNGTSPDNMTLYDENDQENGYNVSTTDHQEERLVDILLRDMFTSVARDNSTLEDEVALEGTAREDEGEAGVENEEAEEEENLTPRQRRKNRKQRKKMMRKQRRKVYLPGVKFCCKQGVKHKKNILEFDSSSGKTPVPCDMSIAVVTTFANHQFGTEEDTCNNTFITCCHRFTEEIWDGIRAKKEARKTERKQRRKLKRQGRKQRRKQERQGRRNKKHMRAHHDEHEEPVVECAGEGEACVQVK